MKRFPPHVPILECADGDDGRWPPAWAVALVQGMRTAWVDDPGSLSVETICRLLLEHELILARSGSGVDICRPEMAKLTDVVSDSAGDDPGLAGGRLDSWLTECCRRTPLYGAVLIGGASTRMGRPKHLIKRTDGCSWLEHLISLLEPLVIEAVVSGAGELPDSLRGVERVDDLAGVAGPLAGIGALLRKRPFVTWLVCACDMPYITSACVEWLLAQRKRGHAAVVPRNLETSRSEPLFAWYDYRSSPLVEDLIAAGSSKISELCPHEHIYQPEIPRSRTGCWRNINYPEQV